MGYLTLLLYTLIVIGLFINPITAQCNCSNIGAASTFGVLASTYTNTAAGTFISIDLGYVTPPATAPTVSGTTHVADATYTQAGTDQATALASLNSQACTFSFAAGAIDLAVDTTHGPIGIYTPGVYCTTGANSIGTGGITLTGTGTFIFKSTGALNTVAGSVVTVSTSSICNIFWLPVGATTLGANTVFAGTVIDDAGITVGSTVNWIDGRALAFGGTVSTTTDNIASPVCPTEAPTTSPTSNPTTTPTTSPTVSPTNTPTSNPTTTPTTSPTVSPTNTPTSSPTHVPTNTPTHVPTISPTPSVPTTSPSTETPTNEPTNEPTSTPTRHPHHRKPPREVDLCWLYYLIIFPIILLALIIWTCRYR